MQIRTTLSLAGSGSKRFNFGFIQKKREELIVMLFFFLVMAAPLFGCVQAPAQGHTPAQLVDEFVDAAVRGGRGEHLATYLDLDGRAQTLYPLLYRNASQEDKSSFRAFLMEGLSKDLTAFTSEIGERTVFKWVESHPNGIVRVRWELRTRRGWDGRWFDLKGVNGSFKIVQSHRRVSSKIVGPAPWIRGLRAFAAERSGGAPTLLDIMKWAPTYHRVRRARVIKVPDHLPARPTAP
jgi:hypothetical protein